MMTSGGVDRYKDPPSASLLSAVFSLSLEEATLLVSQIGLKCHLPTKRIFFNVPYVAIKQAQNDDEVNRVKIEVIYSPNHVMHRGSINAVFSPEVLFQFNSART